MARKALVVLLLMFPLGATTNAQATVIQTQIVIQSAVLLSAQQVQVTGTITCDSPGQYGVNVQVLQQGPQRENRVANGFTSDLCSPGTDTWVITATGGPFNPNKALVQAFGGECDPGCSQDEESRQIRLRRA